MISIKDVKNDSEVKALINVVKIQIEALGFTEHSKRHSSIVSKWASEILMKLEMPEREQNLAEIAGYLHDIGNSVSRVEHAQSGAIMAYNILTRMGMSYEDAAEIMMAIGNHDEQTGIPVSNVSAALIIADKADVHKSRVNINVRNVSLGKDINIHDRVNLAAESSFVTVDNASKLISIEIKIDPTICEIMDYFEIYHARMQLSRRAAALLGCKFALVINDNKLM